MDLEWDKPTVVFYRERTEKPEREPFAVVKARRILLSEDRLTGRIDDFFPLMGEVDIIDTQEGRTDSYVLCWPHDEEQNPKKAWKRLIGVTFSGFTSSEAEGKISYKVEFRARSAKID